MKLLSTQRNSYGNRLLCDEAVFDPSLMSIASVDSTEKVITLQYDYSECGHPLNLPFEASNVDFLLKFTPHNIHICAIATLADYDYDAFQEYTNGLGDVEFDVRLTTDERLNLLLAIIVSFLNEEKMETT